jgi:hypothetical protein
VTVPTLGSFLRQQSNAVVGRSLSMGGTQGDAERALRSAYPDATPDQIAELYDRGLQAWQAADIWGQRDPQNPLTIADVPAAGGLPCGYRFYANSLIVDAATGELAGDQLIIESQSPPSYQQVDEAMQAMAEQRWAKAPSFPGDRYTMTDPQVVEYTVYAVERTVC